jgi:cytochrome P450
MFLLTVTAAAALFYLFVIYPWSRRAAKQAIEREAARRGCAPLPVLRRKGFLGFGWFIESIRATKNDWGPQYVAQTTDAEMGKDVHTFYVPIFDFEVMMTRDPANVQAVLATESQDWDIGEYRTASWAPMFGDGVFTARGEHWKHSRALVRPQFSMDQINDLDLIERHVQELFAAIDRRYSPCAGAGLDAGWTPKFDLLPLFYNLTLDITTELIYGYSVHSQNPSQRLELPVIPGYDAPDRENIGMHMDGGKLWIETRGAFGRFRWLLPTRKFYAHCAAIHKYADWFVQLRLSRGDKYLDGLQSETGQPSKDRFVLLHELAKATKDPVELRSQTLNILTAGRDTTASLLGWVFYFLARHPGVLAKLRNEVVQQFGPFRQSGPTGIEFRVLRDSVPYLYAVINEALRMAPVVPLNERVALRDTVLPRGGGPNRDKPVFVPKGTQVLIPTFAMLRREDLWGPDVEQFRPERWVEDGGRKFGFEFIPFGGGARQCLGRE